MALERAIAELTQHQREVFLLYEVEGFRHAEIAGMLEISETASKNTLFQAKKNLRVKAAATAERGSGRGEMNLSCDDRERIFSDGTSEEWAALRAHGTTCVSCAEELRAWNELSSMAAELRDYRESPTLWSRIETSAFSGIRRHATGRDRKSLLERLVEKLFDQAWSTTGMANEFGRSAGHRCWLWPADT